MKMELIDCSETSAIVNQTPGNYPKGNLLCSVHGESLKSRRIKQFMYTILYGIEVSKTAQFVLLCDYT